MNNLLKHELIGDAIAFVITAPVMVFIGRKLRKVTAKQDIQAFQNCLKADLELKKKEFEELASEVLKLKENESEWDDHEAWEDEFNEALAMQHTKAGEIKSLTEVIECKVEEK